MAVCIATHDGAVYTAGDTDVEFTIQSMSKPFVYALAIADLGMKGVLAKVEVEPSGEAINVISLEAESGRREHAVRKAGDTQPTTLVYAECDGVRLTRLPARIRNEQWGERTG